MVHIIKLIFTRYLDLSRNSYAKHAMKIKLVLILLFDQEVLSICMWLLGIQKCMQYNDGRRALQASWVSHKLLPIFML